jgi:hypothetical protein
MPLNAPNEGESRMLEYIVNKSTPATLYLKLFGNNMTPAENDTAASFTEVSGGGYANKSMTPANWTVANGNNAVATHTAQTFTFTGATTPNTVYGYYLVSSTDNRVMWSERFSDGPYAINNNGDSITITARLELEG